MLLNITVLLHIVVSAATVSIALLELLEVFGFLLLLLSLTGIRLWGGEWSQGFLRGRWDVVVLLDLGTYEIFSGCCRSGIIIESSRVEVELLLIKVSPFLIIWRVLTVNLMIPFRPLAIHITHRELAPISGLNFPLLIRPYRGFWSAVIRTVHSWFRLMTISYRLLSWGRGSSSSTALFFWWGLKLKASSFLPPWWSLTTTHVLISFSG